jgi:Ner family transcriptional regulator
MCEKCIEQALASGRESAELHVQPVNGDEPDWHTADIIAAVKKKGLSMVALSKGSGLAKSTLSNVLYRPWPKGERIVSDCIGVPMCVIWPSRYRQRE